MSQKRPTNDKPVRFAASALAAFVLAGYLGYRGFRKWENSFSKPARDEATDTAAEGPGSTDLESSLITDSILSIVQNYYVDPERVGNAKLVRTAFSALAGHPRIRSGGNEKRLWLEVGDERITVSVEPEPAYERILEIYDRSYRLLQESGIRLVSGTHEQRKPSGVLSVLNRMLAALDSHSALLSPEAYRELRQGTEGTFGGLGVLVGMRDSLLTVIDPLDQSPAKRVGIETDDRILGIDGVNTYGYTLDELVKYMRGDPGTSVELSLLREGAPFPVDVSLKREVIHVDSVTTEVKSTAHGPVLHLTIDNFSSRTSTEVLDAVKEAQLNEGALAGLVLDLRSNPGGLLDQAVQVADLFLHDGVIVSTKGRREEVETAGGGFDEVGYPIAVLINGESASASEIVAGALQDHGRGIVVGRPSFGKGSVQTVFELPGERALKLTIARYYTPQGRTIQNIGIIPDVWLQPIYRGQENRNLMGRFRYKNERFLRNHLTAAGGGPEQQTGIRHAARKGYYLKDLPEARQTEKQQDRELRTALSVIREVRKTYPDELPESADRASHWLGLAGPELRKRLLSMNQQVSSWLDQKFDVPWSVQQQTNVETNLDLEFVGKKVSVVEPGDDVVIPWTIHNRADETVERVSVFVRSEAEGFETKEVLVGRVPPKGTQSGRTRIQIPPYWEPGPLVLRVGAAVDAWPEGRVTKRWPVTVESRRTATLAPRVELVAEHGGERPGVLEGREKAGLRVAIRNEGPVTAEDVTVGFVNLSGTQIEVGQDGRDVGEIAPGETARVTVPIEASGKLYTKELGLGLYVKSHDLERPVRERVAVQARATGKRPGIAEVLGH